MTNTAKIAKFNMIEQQIRPWEVLDGQVLAVIDDIDRKDFVQDIYKGLAYADCQVPVCAGVTMLPPTIEGRMLQSLLIEADDKILEVGPGCGYITAASAPILLVKLDFIKNKVTCKPQAGKRKPINSNRPNGIGTGVIL